MAPPVNFGTTALFFDASLVWSTTTNGVPDWWEMEYFGNLHQPANGDYDGDGVNNGQEYTNGTDPNKIRFQISFTNQYANVTNVPLSVGVQGGVPSYWAVMLDSTNFPAASWTAYTSSNITASLGTNQGWHTVWVGLRGLPATAQQTWNAVRLDLDLTPPRLVVTNATNVTIPLLQLQGYASEELSSLTFDLTNASGAISNQTGFMTGAIFDTNSFAYTNASFKCFDLALASGVNRVTLHATDLAGNVTTTNFIFNLDYSSKPPPVLQLYWPTNGAQIAGSSFTWRGTVDDPTVALSAQITDTNGDTNVVAGVVERNGNWWVDNIPLGTGTNWLTLTATDIHSNVTTTNITVVQSSVAITINPISGDLTAPSVTVTATLNTTNYTLWVNGVEATNSSGTWTAENVPLNGGGMAVVQARAIANTDHGGNGTGNGGGGTNSSLSVPGNPPSTNFVDAEMDVTIPPSIVYASGNFSMPASVTWSGPGYMETAVYNNSCVWSTAGGGSYQYSACDQSSEVSYITDTEQSLQWDASGVGVEKDYTSTNGCGTAVSPPSGSYFYFGWPDYCMEGQECGIWTDGSATNGTVYQLLQTAAVQVIRKTGGLSISGTWSFFQTSARASAAGYPYGPYTFYDGESGSAFWTTAIPSQNITVQGEAIGGSTNNAISLPTPIGQAGSDSTFGSIGSRYDLYPNGETFECTPIVTRTALYVAEVGQIKYNPVISANGIALDPYNVNPSAIFCVGQQVNFSFAGNLAGIQSTNITWSFNGDFITASNQPATGSPIYTNDPTLLTNQTASVWWMSGGSTAAGTTYTATLTETLIFTNGNPPQTVTNQGRFTMYRPTIYFYTNNFYNPGDNDVGGAIFTNVVSGVTNIMLGTYPAADFTAYIHSIFSGPAGITQLLKGYASNAIGGINTTNTYQLDNAEFYSTPPYTGPTGLTNVIAGAQGSYTNNIVTINDAPDINCTNNTALHLDFTDYIRFKPAGGNSNIFVTLGIVNWHIYETAALSNSIYVFSSGPDGHIDPIYTDSKIFPVWTNVANNVAP